MDLTKNEVWTWEFIYSGEDLRRRSYTSLGCITVMLKLKLTEFCNFIYVLFKSNAKGMKMSQNISKWTFLLFLFSEPLCQKFFQTFPHLQMGVLPKENGSKSLVFGRSIIDKDGKEKNPSVFNQTHLVFIGTEGPTLFNLAVCSKGQLLFIYFLCVDKMDALRKHAVMFILSITTVFLYISFHTL